MDRRKAPLRRAVKLRIVGYRMDLFLLECGHSQFSKAETYLTEAMLSRTRKLVRCSDCLRCKSEHVEEG